MVDAPEPQSSPGVAQRLSQEASFWPRKFSPEDLEAMDRVVKAAGRWEIGWTIGEKGGNQYASRSLSDIMDRVVWSTVNSFSVRASQSFSDKQGHHYSAVDVHVFTFTGAGPRIMANCDVAADREGTEATFRKLVDMVGRLPRSGWKNRFWTDRDAQRAWWDIRRPPQSIVDWLAIGLVVALSAALAIGLWRILL